MKLRDATRPAAALLAALAVAVGLAACGSSDGSGSTVTPSVPVTVAQSTSIPTTVVPEVTAAASTTTVAVIGTTPIAPPATEPPTITDNALIVTDAEVADLEKQLDEIDQLLAGVDADLSQD